MAARSGVMPASPEGPTSACLFTPALLRVETIFGEKRVLKVTLVPNSSYFFSTGTIGAHRGARDEQNP